MISLERFLIVAALLSSALSCAGENPAPSLVFVENAFDFGDLSQGDEARHSFALENVGGANLVIKRVDSSCGCTTDRILIRDGAVEQDYVMGSTIAPGQKARLEVRLETERLEGDRASRISVHSNDPAHPLRVLTVAGTIKKLFNVDPPRVYQANVFTKLGAKATVHVTSRDGGAFEIDGSEPLPDWLTLDVLRPDQRTADLLLHFKPGLPEGPLGHRLALHVKAPGEARVRRLVIDITGQVQGILQVTPPHAGFGLVSQGKPHTMMVTLEAQDPTRDIHVAVARIESAAKEHLAVTCNVESEGHRYTLELKLSEHCPGGVLRGIVVVSTDHPEKPEIAIPFSGMVR